MLLQSLLKGSCGDYRLIPKLSSEVDYTVFFLKT